MKRGDLVTIALQGAYGKPRPALVVQSDLFANHPSVTVLPVTTELRNVPIFRVEIEPDKKNNLKNLSQIMVDKIQTVPSDKIGSIIGRIDDTTMLTINRALAVWLGFA
jgi:mRNA interferase MazF